jgi:hypothetical protein
MDLVLNSPMSSKRVVRLSMTNSQGRARGLA